MPRTLIQLQPGESATVESVGGESVASSRLMDLGLIRGTTVRMVRAAPLGDPIEVSLRGFMLTLRRSEAEQVVLR
ncbi:MAG: FeoA domain-containing protein [Gemmatimonadota bacterium]|nr:FeoA domain-containing protein [Gemmatimonadota bacterium]